MDAGLAISGGLLTTVLGMIVVFIALIALIFLTWVMSRAFRSALAKEGKDAAIPAVAGVPAPAAAFANRGEAVAAISAAIAMAMGKTGGGFRIHSITKTGESDRGESVAAISAAIATHLGKEGGGLRIHSITKAD